MGLASAYGIATQANGIISVYSEVGHGSMFRVYLPMAVGKVEHLNGKVERPAAKKGNETILVAEDNEQVRSVLVHTLEHYGYKVLDADSGDTALSLAKKHHGPIDLLLTDLIMPRVGGTELAQRLRQSHPNVPVIFISGYTEEAVSAQGVEGINGVFLQKPVMPTDLAAKVREVLDSRVPVQTRSE
jgi:CheY-like chemotaxis protein